jgi:hypothetical protein
MSSLFPFYSLASYTSVLPSFSSCRRVISLFASFRSVLPSFFFIAFSLARFLTNADVISLGVAR